MYRIKTFCLTSRKSGALANLETMALTGLQYRDEGGDVIIISQDEDNLTFSEIFRTAAAM